MADDLSTLAIEAACRRLVLRAAAFVDGDAPDALGDLFTDDAVLVRPAGAPLAGRAAIVESYRGRAPGRITRHLVTQTLVEVESSDRVRALSTVIVWTGDEADAPTPQGRPARGAQRVGEFDDRFRLTPEGWRIERRDARFVLYRD